MSKRLLCYCFTDILTGCKRSYQEYPRNMSFESSQAMISHVEDHLLKANSIDLSYIEKMLGRLNSTNIDFGDIYFQKRISESWSIDDRAVKNGSFSIDQGFGVRAVSGEKTALAYSDEINERALHQTVRAARSVSKQAGSGESRIDFTRGYLVRIKDKFDPVGSLPREQKVLMLREMDTFARSLDSRVVQVMANLTSSDKEFLVANTDGTLAADVIPGVHLSCTVIVEENGVRENGYSASGKAADLGFFQEDVPVISMDFIRGISPDAVSGTMEKRYLAIARDAVRCALVNLRARPAEAGELTVILASGWPAVLFHEAVGHGLEADAVRKNTSVFSGKIGEQVASSLCTVIDSGIVSNGSGSFNVDSEGTPAQENVLIDNGILKGFMYDRSNAMLMGAKSTGNGRRMDYDCCPIPRMTNTYLAPGTTPQEDVIASAGHGIYAVNFQGGQVDPSTGKFTFSMSEAYVIENGKVLYPVKGATLIGNCIDALKQVSLVGNNLSFDRGCGACGKEGQSVRVGIGMPTIRLDSITVGGTKG